MTHPDVTRFRALLAGRMGWTFADQDGTALAAELDRRTQARAMTAPAYLTRLAAHPWPEEMAAITEGLTITETYFFRHGEQFRALTETVLPDRLAARGDQRVLRMLSVGCSSGEEAYSLAIVARRMRPDRSWLVSVLGLDTNPAMLRKAAAARYSAWSMRETPDEVRQDWFHPHGADYEVHAEIRATVRWKRYNAAEEDTEIFRGDQYDVIFCRNLLMYLTPATGSALVQRMTRALCPGGYLFLGHTDSLGSRPEGLEPRQSHSTFYYRRPVRPVPAAPPPLAVTVVTPPLPPARADGYDRILALIGEEQFAEALAVVDNGDGLTTPRDVLVHGVLLAHAGRLAEAEIVVRGLLDTDGLNPDAHHQLAVCLEGGAAVDVAIGHYRLAAYLDPAFALPRLRLGLLARRHGDHRAAATELDHAMHLLREERDDRIVLFGGGFGRTALTALCRAELDACGVRR